MEHILQSTGYEVFDKSIISGIGCSLFDEQGKRYVDFEAGVWSTALGHSHPRINKVIKNQVERIMHLGYRYNNPLVESAAVAVLEITGITEGKCIFLSSGSEAVEFGVQILRRMSGKPLLLGMAGSYLAAYGSAGKRSLDEWHLFDWSGCSACKFSEQCDPECPLLKKIPFEKVGGLVFEPGNTSGLVKLPPKPLIKQLEKKVKEQGGIVMANEITTGIGRTGAWFGYNHYDLQPDVIAIGKSIGNGYPVSVVAMNGHIAEDLENSGFHYAQSHQNDALGCAVVSEVINVIKEEGLIERSRFIGGEFKNQLIWLMKLHKGIKEIRGRGLMLAMEFTPDNQYLLNNVHRKLFEDGFLVGYNSAAKVFRFYPALVIMEEDVNNMIEKLNVILK